MMDDRNSKYSYGEGMDFPRTYQFSPFYGVRFLEAYRDYRSKAIDHLKGKSAMDTESILKTVKAELENRTAGISHSEWFESLKDKPVDTRKNLEMLLLALLNGCHSADKDVRFWLRTYLKKYEVAKKLYSEYDKDLKRMGNCDDIDSYALLAVCLLLYYMKDRNLKFLNCAMKLNDMLCSNIGRISSEFGILLCYSSLRMELDAAYQLCEEHGVQV